MESSECPLTICAVRARPNPPGSSSSLPDNRRRCPFLFDQRHFLYQPAAKPLPPQPFLLYGMRILIYSHAPKTILLLSSNLAFLLSSYLRAVYYTVDLQTSLRLGHPRHLQLPFSLSLSLFLLLSRSRCTPDETLMERDFGKIETSIRYGRILRYLSGAVLSSTSCSSGSSLVHFIDDPTIVRHRGRKKFRCKNRR